MKLLPYDHCFDLKYVPDNRVQNLKKYACHAEAIGFFKGVLAGSMLTVVLFVVSVSLFG